MEHREQYWTMQDGARLFAQEWKDSTAPKGVVALVHGLGEHSGRYEHVAQIFTAAGYEVMAFDLRGHGRTEGIRGYIPSTQTMISDISYLLDQTAAAYPGLPRFLYGHSMGGSMVLFYILTQKPAIAGAIVTAPGLGTAVPVPAWKDKLGRFMYRVWPTFQMPNGLDVTGLSHDTRVVDAYTHDALVHPTVTARLGIDIIDNGKWILANAGNLSLPLLLMQGSADRIVNPEMVKQFAAAAPTDRITFKLWDGLYHELHNEPQKAEVLQTMITWLNCQVSKG